MLGCRIDLCQTFGLQRRNSAPAQDVDHAEDGVHRRANLVAHIGQEGALGKIGRFGGILRFGQFGRARGDEFGEMVAVLFKLSLGTLPFGDVLQRTVELMAVRVVADLDPSDAAQIADRTVAVKDTHHAVACFARLAFGDGASE